MAIGKTVRMFTQAGFFHFGCEHNKPIESLRAALCRADTSGALVVLPEAFNIGKHYRDDDRACDYHPAVLKALLALSVEFKVTFVAGLVVRRCGFPERPPLSAAYLISGPARRTLMCYKRLPDNSRNYTPCEGQNCDAMNPLLCNGHWIGATICRDLDDFERSIALQNRFDAVDKADNPCRFLCVPGHMYKHYYGGGAIGTDGRLRPESKNMVTILANSDPVGCKSFITNRTGVIVTHVPDEDRGRNKIVLEHLGGL